MSFIFFFIHSYITVAEENVKCQMTLVRVDGYSSVLSDVLPMNCPVSPQYDVQAAPVHARYVRLGIHSNKKQNTTFY